MHAHNLESPSHLSMSNKEMSTLDCVSGQVQA